MVNPTLPHHISRLRGRRLRRRGGPLLIQWDAANSRSVAFFLRLGVIFSRQAESPQRMPGGAQPLRRAVRQAAGVDPLQRWNARVKAGALA